MIKRIFVAKFVIGNHAYKVSRNRVLYFIKFYSALPSFSFRKPPGSSAVPMQLTRSLSRFYRASHPVYSAYDCILRVLIRLN